MSAPTTMSRVTRTSLALVAVCLVGATAQAQPPAPKFTRISTAEFAKDSKKVAALKQAVTAMKAANSATNTTAAYRGSWEYWAATHGYFGAGENSSGMAADFIAAAPSRDFCGSLPPSQRKICLTYFPHVKDNALPNDGITPSVWGMCQHSTQDTQNLHFLTWHRMYLHFFERVLRKNSGDPNFALPYWDYFAERGRGGRGLALTSLVRGTSTGPLFDRFRTPGLNENTTAIPATTASAAGAFAFTDLQNFSGALEDQPHGVMHCATGFSCAAPDMGIVPVAGLDPVFYMHHANIDRLWQCWLTRKAAGQPITLAWAKANLGMDDSWFSQTFTFVDENGASATMAVQDLFQPGVIDSGYDKVTDCVPGAPKPPVAAAAVKPTPVPSMSNAAPVELKGKAVSVPLRPQVGAPAPRTDLRVETGRTLLILENVTIQGHPGILYDIHIHGRKNPAKSAYVATINYFGKLGPGHGAHRREAASAPPTIKRLLYDVTSQLAQLGLSGQNATDIAVRFVPNSGTLQAATVTKDAGTVTVGSIRLETQ